MATTSQSLQVKPVSARISLGDAIVIIGAVAAVLLGWALKSYHDDRLTTDHAGAVTVAYPTGWFRVPVNAPELLRANANGGARASLILAAQPTTQTDVNQALLTGDLFLANGEPSFAQLRSERATVDGNVAVRSEYAYVRVPSGGASLPTVIRGRQYAWIKGGRRYVLALEAPERDWDAIEGDFGRMVDRVRTSP